jgi:hypothetical protein
MSKEEYFEGHRIPKNNVYMVIVGRLPNSEVDVTTFKNLKTTSTQDKSTVIRGAIKQIFNEYEEVYSINIKFLPEDMYGGEQ